jgi:hypothetical protein
MRRIAWFYIFVFVMLATMFVGLQKANALHPNANTVCVRKAIGFVRNPNETLKKSCEKSEVKFETVKTAATNTSKSSAFRQRSICGAGGIALCKIGVRGPGGGLIFFVDYYDQYAGFDYLEVAPTSCETLMMWSSTDFAGKALMAWDVSAVGRGQANTEAILTADLDETVSNSAAKFADWSECGSQTDWFLGSIGEMKLIYTNLAKAGVGGFSSHYYWSSSEYDDRYAWTQGFDYGFQDGNYKGTVAYVRPIRAF